ncbi:MAG: glycosyltransferase [Rhodoblastus sp.]|nr:glycosyltransferase [Rhodoblastus sp.]
MTLAASKDVADQELPLAGKTVAVVHAAWHSCGSYQVNVSQAAVYKQLGARVISLAVREWPPGQSDLSSPRWRDYISHTQDMPADERYYANMPGAIFARPAFWGELYWPLIHGDHARATAAMTKFARLPDELALRSIDLIHCNHFFCIPAARNLSATAPLVIETQDVQALQYDLRNEGIFVVPPRATYDQLLATELDFLRKADLLVHLNAEEWETFEKLLPEMRNALVYPAVEEAPTGPGGGDIVIVASGNFPNTLSVEWFLEHVAPKAPHAQVKIAGNVDGALKTRNPALYEKWKHLFLGRVDDIGAIYANAGLVLLPTTEGHGLSIKAVEALSSGAPLIATPQAFRGMKVDPAQLANVALCASAEEFAAALEAAAVAGPAINPLAAGAARERNDTRQFYDENFSHAAYLRKIRDIVLPLVTP